MRPNIVVRTAFCTLGDAVSVKREMRSDGVSLETTLRYGFVRAGLFSPEDERARADNDVVFVDRGPN